MNGMMDIGLYPIGELRKWTRGVYRMTLDDQHFAQLKRYGHRWTIEIRYTNSGDLKRYAGLLSTLREATDEAREFVVSPERI